MKITIPGGAAQMPIPAGPLSHIVQQKRDDYERKQSI
jgi:hypothetical protein